VDCAASRTSSLAESSLYVVLEGSGYMRVITVEARSLDAAHRLYSALSEFHPELNGVEDDG
jgi:hypothetical protein